ncbi:multiple epidermal growth factor-like domains protein 11 [Ostrea edulis]|uniref:multiple epidermal growth factor-like domains protein 11 n=1 Tax=Ostrea edulis TaxID=37623 RepID=UPI0024AEB3AE|nr:multiple epidermal growth factor-like domains protein 11 [Ostrea edulis]
MVTRQRGRAAGFSLYVSNTTIKEDGYLCYKNGQELPPLDFSTTCVKHGRYVIFYNERLGGITYPTGYETAAVHTELCEVTVTGCEESDVFGYNCDLPCPINCQESRCDIVNGTCLVGCTAGWVGYFCNKSCPAGYYGLQCNSTCIGHCRDNLSCNHTTGRCDYGCECPAESYGPDCMYNCSGQCLSYLPCNRTTGRCDGGCNPGYTAELCDKECSVKTYGKGCGNHCSSHCRNMTCDPINGSCLEGCIPGYLGSFCNKPCDNGTYGLNCSQNCSQSCLDICDSVDGSCTCSSGWTGSPDCNEICNATFYGENCSVRCNENCVNQSCDHITGSCTYGCKPGWRTHNCTQSNS